MLIIPLNPKIIPETLDWQYIRIIIVTPQSYIRMWFISKLYIPAWEYIEYMRDREKVNYICIYTTESIEYFKPPLNVIISHEGMLFVP